MTLFMIFGVATAFALVLSWVLTGQLSPENVQLAAFAYILMGVGYLISLVKKREKGVDGLIDNVKYISERNNKAVIDELKSIRKMIVNLEASRGRRGTDSGQEDAQ